jgi:hypothetical protein
MLGRAKSKRTQTIATAMRRRDLLGRKLDADAYAATADLPDFA